MVLTNKNTQNITSFYFVIYSIITLLFLTFLLTNTIIIDFSSKNQAKQKIYNRRKLQIEINQTETNLDYNETILNGNLSNETNMTSEDTGYIDTKSPFFYLTGYYIVFVLMSIYMISIINRSPISQDIKESIKADIWRFLFIANNGSLLVSIIFLSEVYSISGFAPFGLGLTILIIGTIYYLRKINDECLAQFFAENKMELLCKIPCLIIKIVKYTYECCRCQYYDITVTTVYNDGHVEKDYCCTSIICCLWNMFCLILKIMSTIFTVISYYIFLGIFWIIWKIGRCIYLKRHPNENKDVNVNNNMGNHEYVDGNINQPVNNININQQIQDNYYNYSSSNEIYRNNNSNNNYNNNKENNDYNNYNYNNNNVNNNDGNNNFNSYNSRSEIEIINTDFVPEQIEKERNKIKDIRNMDNSQPSNNNINNSNNNICNNNNEDDKTDNISFMNDRINMDNNDNNQKIENKDNLNNGKVPPMVNNINKNNEPIDQKEKDIKNIEDDKLNSDKKNENENQSNNNCENKDN